MGRLNQNYWDDSGNAMLLAKAAVGRKASAETCRIVIGFIDRLMATNPSPQTLNDVWFSSPVDIAPTPNGTWEETYHMLRVFFSEMRRLLAERLEFLESQK